MLECSVGHRAVGLEIAVWNVPSAIRLWGWRLPFGVGPNGNIDASWLVVAYSLLIRMFDGQTLGIGPALLQYTTVSRLPHPIGTRVNSVEAQKTKSWEQ